MDFLGTPKPKTAPHNTWKWLGVLVAVGLVVTAVTLLVMHFSKSEKKGVVPSGTKQLAAAYGAPLRKAAGSAPAQAPVRATAAAVSYQPVNTSIPAAPASQKRAATIWDGPLEDPMASAVMQGPRTLSEKMGASTTRSPYGSKDLYNTKPDELDAKDVDVAKSAFPLEESVKGLKGNEAINASYNYSNFRQALDQSSTGGYLRPIPTRDGWSTLGDRNMPIWQAQIKGLIHALPKNVDPNKFMDENFVGVPDQFYDLFMEEAARRGIQPAGGESCSGMGVCASGELYDSLVRDYEKQHPRTTFK